MQVLPTNPPSPTPVDPDNGGGGDIPSDSGGSSSTGKIILGIAGAGLFIGAGFMVNKKRQMGDSSAYNNGFQYQKQDDMEMFSGMTVNNGSFQPPTTLAVSSPNTANI